MEKSSHPFMSIRRFQINPFSLPGSGKVESPDWGLRNLLSRYLTPQQGVALASEKGDFIRGLKALLDLIRIRSTLKSETRLVKGESCEYDWT